MQGTLRALYLNDWFRIPFKFVFLFALVKVGYDYYEYRSAFRWRKTNPRFDIKHYYRLQNGLHRKWMNWQDRNFVIVDLPCRENPNAIDQLLLRGKQFSCSETVKFYLLSELAQREGSLPPGVYRQIREAQTPQLTTPITPRF